EGPEMCRFLDAGNNEALGSLSCQASKKRQGTKSREVGHRLGSERYGGFDVSAELDGGRDTARKRPGCVDRRGEEPAMGISASARSASAGARSIDRRDRVERDHCRRRASASEREVATLIVGLSHDVSTLLGIGRRL